MTSKSSSFSSIPILLRNFSSSIALTRNEDVSSTIKNRTRPERATRDSNTRASAASKSTNLPERSSLMNEEARGQRERGDSAANAKTSINTAKTTSRNNTQWMSVTRKQRDAFWGYEGEERPDSYDDIEHDYGSDDNSDVEQVIRRPGSVYPGSLEPDVPRARSGYSSNSTADGIARGLGVVTTVDYANRK